MKYSALVSILLCASAAASWMGCSSDAPVTQENTGAFTDGACKLFSVKENRFLKVSEVAALKDPVAQFIFRNKDKKCPENVSEIQSQLKDCDAPRTRFVSDRAHMTKKADEGRTVTTRACPNTGAGDTDKLPAEGLFLLLNPVHSDVGDKTGEGPAFQPIDSKARTIEMIGMQKAKDETDGVFNYYALEDLQGNRTWKFFGSSEDYVQGGYDCQKFGNGACIPKAAEQTRCASCHTGGGLIMKELDSPWTNWEHFTPDFNPSEGLVSRHAAVFGTGADGAEMENRVRNGNEFWNPRRLETLKKLGTKEVLRPLFCTVEINFQTSGDRDGKLDRVRGDFFTDPSLASGSSVSVDDADYKALLTESGQKILLDIPGNVQFGTSVDSAFAFVYPERSASDRDYVQLLADKGILDKTQEFVRDVLSIDFTRPVYSPIRCQLVEFAPKAGGLTPDAIRDGFIANLSGTTTEGAALLATLDAKTKAAAAELLASLKDAGDTAAHRAAVTKFGAACTARFEKAELSADEKKIQKKRFLSDVMKYAAFLRETARTVKRPQSPTSTDPLTSQFALGIVDNDEMFPFTPAPFRADKAFDPVTCELTKE